MLTIINQNLFEILESEETEVKKTGNNEMKFKKRKIQYICPNSELKNRNKKNTDGSYCSFKKWPIFEISTSFKNKNLNGILKLKAKTDRKNQHPTAFVGLPKSEFDYDADVILLAIPYNGIISPVESTKYARLMAGCACCTTDKTIIGPDTGNTHKHKTRNVLYLAIEAVTPTIKKSIRMYNKQKENIPLLEVGKDYCDLLAFTTKHLFKAKNGETICRTHTRKLRATLVNDKLVYTVTPMITTTEAVSENYPIPASGSIWKRYKYPDKKKSGNKPSTMKSTGEKKDSFDKKSKEEKKHHSYNKNQSSPDKQFKPKDKPYRKNDDKRPVGREKSTVDGNRQVKDSKQKKYPSKKKVPQYNKNGIRIQ